MGAQALGIETSAFRNCGYANVLAGSNTHEVIMATVMWDLDGVSCLWVPNFYPWLCELNDLTPTEWEIWHHYRTHGISDEDFVKHLQQYAEEGRFAEQTPVPGFQKAVRQIKAAGHSQHVVTDRPAIAEADTAWWVDTYAPEIDTLTLSRDKTVFTQYDDGAYWALDDRTENVQAMREAGINAYLLTWPWNADADLPRMASVEEFAAIVVGI